MAAELNVNSVHWRGIQLQLGSDPGNINFTALQRAWWARSIRSVFALIAIIAIMLFPFGVFSGICS